MRKKALLLSLTLTTAFHFGAVEAAPTDLCRESYGRMMKRNVLNENRADTVLALFTAQVAAGLLGFGFMAAIEKDTELSDKVLEKISHYSKKLGSRARRTIVAAEAAFILYSAVEFGMSHGYHQRIGYAETIGHAMDEADSAVIGPATLALTEYVRIAIRNNWFWNSRDKRLPYRFAIPRSALKELGDAFPKTSPTPEQIQGAIQFMKQTGSACYADYTGLNPAEFSRRFAYALRMVASPSTMRSKP